MVGNKGSDFDDIKSKEEEDHLCFGCFMCRGSSREVDHLLLYCQFAVCFWADGIGGGGDFDCRKSEEEKDRPYWLVLHVQRLGRRG